MDGHTYANVRQLRLYQSPDNPSARTKDAAGVLRLLEAASNTIAQQIKSSSVAAWPVKYSGPLTITPGAGVDDIAGVIPVTFGPAPLVTEYIVDVAEGTVLSWGDESIYVIGTVATEGVNYPTSLYVQRGVLGTRAIAHLQSEPLTWYEYPAGVSIAACQIADEKATEAIAGRTTNVGASEGDMQTVSYTHLTLPTKA